MPDDPAQLSVPAPRPFGPGATLISVARPHFRLAPGKKSMSVERAGMAVLRMPASMAPIWFRPKAATVLG